MLLQYNLLPWNNTTSRASSPSKKEDCTSKQRMCGHLESDSDDELNGLTLVPVEKNSHLTSDQDGGRNETDTAIPVPAEDPYVTPAADGNEIITVTVENPANDIQQSAVAESELPSPVENTRPTRTQNPSSRLSYWTSGSSVTNIPYTVNMNTISAFVEPSYTGIMPIFPCPSSLIPGSHPPSYPFTTIFSMLWNCVLCLRLKALKCIYTAI